jgi:FkbM family methyltransferase
MAKFQRLVRKYLGVAIIAAILLSSLFSFTIHHFQDRNSKETSQETPHTRNLDNKITRDNANSGNTLVRAWSDVQKSGASVQQLTLPAESKQIDIYKTRRTWLSDGRIYSENITLVFLWRTSSCLDPNRDSIPQDLMRTFSAGMKPYDVIIDIGACYGDTTVPLATYANVVLAFEPNPRSFAILEANANLNAAVNIIPYNLAIGEDENLDFFYGGDFCNGGQWGEWKAGDPGEKPVSVANVNLHRFLVAHHPTLIPRIGFIKIDSEGYDARILSTLAPLLAAASPLVEVEWFALFHDAARPDECTAGSRELFRVIAAVGYAPFVPVEPLRPALGCESRHWVPDLLLRPAAAAPPLGAASAAAA